MIRTPGRRRSAGAHRRRQGGERRGHRRDGGNRDELAEVARGPALALDGALAAHHAGAAVVDGRGRGGVFRAPRPLRLYASLLHAMPADTGSVVVTHDMDKLLRAINQIAAQPGAPQELASDLRELNQAQTQAQLGFDATDPDAWRKAGLDLVARGHRRVWRARTMRWPLFTFRLRTRTAQQPVLSKSLQGQGAKLDAHDANGVKVTRVTWPVTIPSGAATPLAFAMKGDFLVVATESIDARVRDGSQAESALRKQLAGSGLDASADLQRVRTAVGEPWTVFAYTSPAAVQAQTTSPDVKPIPAPSSRSTASARRSRLATSASPCAPGRCDCAHADHLRRGQSARGPRAGRHPRRRAREPRFARHRDRAPADARWPEDARAAPAARGAARCAEGFRRRARRTDHPRRAAAHAGRALAGRRRGRVRRARSPPAGSWMPSPRRWPSSGSRPRVQDG